MLLIGPPTATLALSEAALAAHDNAFGPGHAWTKDSARVTADALDALGRTEEAKALREKYGLTEAEKPKPPETSFSSRANLREPHVHVLGDRW